MLNGAKPLGNNNSWAEEKAQNEAFKLERSPTKTRLRRTESYKMLKTTKPLRRRVLIEEGLAKNSKKTALGEHRQVAPL